MEELLQFMDQSLLAKQNFLYTVLQRRKKGGLAAFIDAEHDFDKSYVERLGIDTENLLIAQPDDGEQALEIAEQLIRSVSIDMLVIDYVAALS